MNDDRWGSAALTEPRLRLLAPDLARGSMLLVIAAAHAPAYLVRPRDLAASSSSRLDLATEVASLLLVEGRGYPVFAALFGYGVVQFACRWPADDLLPVLRRRGRWLVVFGAVHAALLWSGDILGAYGVLLIGGAAVMLRGSDQTLAALIAGSWTVVGIGGASMAAARSSFGADALPAWWAAGERLAEWAPTLVLQPVGLLGATLLGVWAARRRVLEEPHRHVTLLRAVAIGGLAVAVLGALPRVVLDLGAVPSTPGLTAAAGGLHSITGYGGIGYAACAALAAASVAAAGQGGLSRAVAALGQRSLTGYLAQSVLFTVVMSPALGRLGERVGSAGAAVVAVGVWGVTVAAAELMRRRGRQGPAETFLRRLVGRPVTPQARR